MTSRRTRSWAILVVGLALVGLAAWLAQRQAAPDSGPGSSASAASQGAPTGPAPTTGTSTSAPAGAPPGAGAGWSVRWVHDGDTLDIVRDGVNVRLRLLNLDAPERGTAEREPQCLAEAATARLTELAPPGTGLSVLAVGPDRYGRTLGEAWLPDGRMLGAEVVRAGLAAPMTVGGRDDFRAVMDAARDEAAAAGRGLHDPKENCTVPAHVVSLEGRAHGIPTDDTPTGAQARAALATDIEAVLADLNARPARPGVAALTDSTRADLLARLQAVRAAALG